MSFVLLPALASPAPPAPLTTPTGHSVLQVSILGGRVYAGMGLNGLAVIDLQRRDKAHVFPDLPTLTTLPLDDDIALLGGRDSIVRLVHAGAAEDHPDVLLQWPVEGIPGGMAMQGNILAIAAGGAGVSLWEWLDRTQPPRLVGRYPFTDYSKELVFSAPDSLLVADGFDTGLLALDVSEPLRPHSTAVISVRGFCDSLALHDSIVAASSRRSGIMTFRLSAGRPPDMLGLIPLASANSQVNRVEFWGGRLISCEGTAGVRVLSPEPDGRWSETALLETPGNALDVALLNPTGADRGTKGDEVDLVVADGDSGVTFLHLKVSRRTTNTPAANPTTSVAP